MMLAQYNTPDGGAGAASIIFLLVWLGIWALVVWGTWRVATNNGRNGGLAVVLGILFGLFALAGYAIAGPTELQKARKAREYMQYVQAPQPPIPAPPGPKQ
jgi:threonine/homoserine/homoserine lactone efflux protein